MKGESRFESTCKWQTGKEWSRLWEKSQASFEWACSWKFLQVFGFHCSEMANLTLSFNERILSAFDVWKTFPAGGDREALYYFLQLQRTINESLEKKVALGKRWHTLTLRTLNREWMFQYNKIWQEILPLVHTRVLHPPPPNPEHNLNLLLCRRQKRSLREFASHRKH